jgi:hypothetical protein
VYEREKRFTLLSCCSEGFYESAVMNNYFGIGIDAKISLDFHQKREEHPEKCRSRAKNYMWYGVLGSKEWLQVWSQSPVSSFLLLSY